MSSSISTPKPTASLSRDEWIWCLCAGSVVGWWINDLRFQWASLIEYRFGWIVVMLTGFLVWERWPNRPQQDQPDRSLWPWLLVLAGVPCLLLAELYKNGIARVPWTSLVLSVGCWAFVVALVLIGHGRKTLRHFIFPLLFFFVAVPLPHLIWDPVVFGLRRLVTLVNVETLTLMGIPAIQVGNVIRLPNCTVGVDEACSGVRSLQSSAMAALFIGDLTLRRPGWKVIFLIAGLTLAIIGNFGRSLYLSLTAHYQGAAALEKVHDSAGWSVLVFTAIGVAVLAWMAGRLEKQMLRQSIDKKI